VHLLVLPRIDGGVDQRAWRHLHDVELVEENVVGGVFIDNSQHLAVDIDTAEGIVGALLPLHLQFHKAAEALALDCAVDDLDLIG